MKDLHIPTDSILDSVRIFYENFSAEIKGYKAAELPVATQKDFIKMQNILNNINVYLTNYPNNPTYFNILNGFQRIVQSNYTIPEKRAEILFHKLDYVPAFYEAAKSQLQTADVQAEIPDRALMEVFTCNVRVIVPSAQYEAAAQFLIERDQPSPAGTVGELDVARARAQMPLEFPVKLILVLLPCSIIPALLVGVWLRSLYSKQGYTKRADTIWVWLRAGFIGWLAFWTALVLSKLG